MIHAVLVAFNNPEQTKTRWLRDVQPALKLAGATFGLPTGCTIVDNSAEMSEELAGLQQTPGVRYGWNMGTNLQYGPAINAAVAERPSVFVLYACTAHGRAFDPTWACDLIGPMVHNPVVGLTGCLWGSNSPVGVAESTGEEWIRDGRYTFKHADGTGHVPKHVQGGVFAARTEVLLRFPYNPAVAHLYTDHLLTWDAMRAGYTALDVPSVRSVWRQVYDKTMLDGVKYIHDLDHT